MWSIFKSPKVPQGLKGQMQNDYVLGRRFDPGAEAEVFIPTRTNPIYFFRGNGRVAGMFATIQPPSVWFPPQQGIQGLGGVQAGQYVGQALIDPSQLEPQGGE
jgi:hypothetical protein